MKPPRKPVSWFARAVGLFLIALGTSTWPNVHWEGVIVGVGVIFGPDFFKK